MAYLPIIASISDLVLNTPVTYLASDATAGDTSLIVESINRFAIDKILLIHEPGNEHAEIIKTDAATAPTGSTVTLASALTFDHPDGTKVYIIDYDQVEFSHATTVDGSKTVLTTMAIDADSPETIYRDSTYSSGYYFVRFKDSINTIYSDYSDPIPYSGWADNQVGSAIEYALKKNKTGFSENLTHEMLLQEARSAISIFLGKLKRWSRLQTFDHSLGLTARGAYAFAAPSDMYGYSPKSVLQVRLAGRPKLQWKDKIDFDKYLDNVKHSTLVSGASTGATSITLTDANDFTDSYTVMIRGIEITGTAWDASTGVLSGIPASGDGSITADLSAGDDVWQGSYEQAEPLYFTVYEGFFYIWPLVSSTWAGKNLFLDYWLEAPTVESDADTLDLTRYDAVKHWLTWVVRAHVKYDGERRPDDVDFQLFTTIMNDAISMELKTQGQRGRGQPRPNTIKFR